MNHRNGLVSNTSMFYSRIVTEATTESMRRPYRSELRARQAEGTRRAVIETATELFVANGWELTGMRDVASATGVSLETIYRHFESKAGLLRAVADVAAAGDDVPVALAERSEFTAMGRGPRSARIGAAADVLTAVHERTAAIARLLRHAAPSDPEIAEMLQATRDRQRLDVARAIELIIGRPPVATEVDGTWAVTSPDVFLLLVDDSGWTAGQYRDWMTEMLAKVIPET